MGEGAFIWSGSALDCPSSNNEIIFLQSDFLHHGWYQTCNNGDIVARILCAQGNNYTTQLHVNVIPDLAGKAVQCEHHNETHLTIQRSITIPTITGLQLKKNSS